MHTHIHTHMHPHIDKAFGDVRSDIGRHGTKAKPGNRHISGHNTLGHTIRVCEEARDREGEGDKVVSMQLHIHT